MLLEELELEDGQQQSTAVIWSPAGGVWPTRKPRSLANIFEIQLRVGRLAIRGAPTVPSGQMPLAEGVHWDGQEMEEELEETGRSQ